MKPQERQYTCYVVKTKETFEEGEGRFHYTSNGACAVQDIGTIQARIKTTASAKRALRKEYDTKRKFFPELFE